MSSSDDLNFAPVPVEMIDTFWDAALEYLQPAIDTAEGKLEAYDLYNDCQMGVCVLWLVIDGSEIIAALTTRIVAYPNKRGYALEFLGGKQMKRWFNMVLDTLQEVAKHNGCTHTSRRMVAGVATLARQKRLQTKVRSLRNGV